MIRTDDSLLKSSRSFILSQSKFSLSYEAFSQLEGKKSGQEECGLMLNRKQTLILEFSVNILTPATVIWHGEMTQAVRKHSTQIFFGLFFPRWFKCLLWSPIAFKLNSKFWVTFSRCFSNLSSILYSLAHPDAFPNIYVHSLLPTFDHTFSSLNTLSSSPLTKISLVPG